MSDTGITSGTRASAASRGRVLSVTLWALQALLALVFAMAGLAKVGGDAAMVEMFATIGVGQWLRYVVGALEITGALGVLIPRLSGLAALGLVCLMVGATLTNVFVLGTSPLLTVGLLVLSGLVAWGRRERTWALLGGLGR
ncbi:MAG: DoxX family protein [Rubrobacter sp.]